MTFKCLRTHVSCLCCVFSLILMCACASSHPSIPPPETSQYVYVANAGDNSISGFEIDSGGQAGVIPGSSFKLSFQPGRLISDPQSRFLLVGAEPLPFMPAAIGTSHTLSFNSNETLPSGYVLMDPRGRFVFLTDNSGAFGNLITHVYSVKTDLSFEEVAGSPSEPYLLPAATDPAGKFIFALELTNIHTLRIEDTGALTEVASTSVNSYPVRALVDPPGRFLYAEHINPAGIQVFQIGTTGTLTTASDIKFPEGRGFSLYAFHPSGNFVLANECTGIGLPTCSLLDTLFVNSKTGELNLTPVYSLPIQWWLQPVLDSTGAQILIISSGTSSSDCNVSVPGLLRVFSFGTDGRLRPTGVTAQTGRCPSFVVVTQ
jgi:DNA-binding beta-propeller fold protein YncE